MQSRSPCTCFSVRRLSRLVTQIYDQRLGALGLKVTQYSLLAHVRALPGVTMGELAARMGMDRSTLTRNLRPLSRAGWIATARGADARAVTVALTDAGRALLTRARPAWRAAQAELAERLGGARTQTLHALADEASAVLGGRPETSPAP